MIRDNLTPRQRQVRETLMKMRDQDAETKSMDLADRVRREQQSEAASTAFWFCPRCRARVPGHGSVCTECDLRVS